MERIKSLCFLIMCSSLILFATTFMDAIYPKGDHAVHAYANMMDEYEKIAADTAIDKEAIQGVVSETEFDNQLPSKEVQDRVLIILQDTKNYPYLFDETELQEISEQFAMIYDQQLTIAENEVYTTSMNTIRLYTIISAIISAILFFLIKRFHLKHKATTVGVTKEPFSMQEKEDSKNKD